MTQVAAIQMQGRLGDLDYNLAHVRELVLEAVQQGAKVISLPEFFTTTIGLDEQRSVYACVLPPQNKALDLLKEIAADHDVLIGGSYLEKRTEKRAGKRADVFNCYTLVRPDGTVTRHDKDLPTMVENAFYIGGDTDGVHHTPHGRVGTAVCWETIRTQTVKRMQGKVDFLMTGSHWWTSPSNWLFYKLWLQQPDVDNREIMRQTPSTLARLLGVANIHSAHTGKLDGIFPMYPGDTRGLMNENQLIGETQIVDNQGNIVARLSQQDGPGVICADIDLTPAEASLPLPDRYWIPELSGLIKFNWYQQNWASKNIYKKAQKEGWF